MAEKVRVLVVDDSVFFRKRIRQELEVMPQIEVAGEASNGREAVELVSRVKPDLITMDVAMPEMDGIAAVRAIMRAQPTNIIMFSALTSDGARATLDALDAGAVDFFPKQHWLDADNDGVLSQRVIEIARRRPAPRATVPPATASASIAPQHRSVLKQQATPKLVLIGASTGGPVAVRQVLAKLPARVPFALVIAVHMPAEFTSTFAERLNEACSLTVRLARNGDALSPGTVLLAPGGYQTLVLSDNGRNRIAIKDGGGQLYKPSIDILFGSAARSIGSDCLAIVLTGMGADGADGARLLKDRGSAVWAQDRATSVVHGMPHAVTKAGLSDRVLALDEIGDALSGLA